MFVIYLSVLWIVSQPSKVMAIATVPTAKNNKTESNIMWAFVFSLRHSKYFFPSLLASTKKGQPIIPCCCCCRCFCIFIFATIVIRLFHSCWLVAVEEMKYLFFLNIWLQMENIHEWAKEYFLIIPYRMLWTKCACTYTPLPFPDKVTDRQT